LVTATAQAEDTTSPSVLKVWLRSPERVRPAVAEAPIVSRCGRVRSTPKVATVRHRAVAQVVLRQRLHAEQAVGLARAGRSRR
jgi:hypothetical protein